MASTTSQIKKPRMPPLPRFSSTTMAMLLVLIIGRDAYLILEQVLVRPADGLDGNVPHVEYADVPFEIAEEPLEILIGAAHLDFEDHRPKRLDERGPAPGQRNLPRFLGGCARGRRHTEGLGRQAVVNRQAVQLRQRLRESGGQRQGERNDRTHVFGV